MYATRPDNVNTPTSCANLTLMKLALAAAQLHTPFRLMPHSAMPRRRVQGEHWRGAIGGHTLGEDDAEEDKKRLLLERFQLEVCSTSCNQDRCGVHHSRWHRLYKWPPSEPQVRLLSCQCCGRAASRHGLLGGGGERSRPRPCSLPGRLRKAIASCSGSPRAPAPQALHRRR